MKEVIPICTRDSLPENLRKTYDLMVGPLDQLPSVANQMVDPLKRVIAEGLKAAYMHGQNDATQRFLKKLDSVE